MTEPLMQSSSPVLGTGQYYIEEKTWCGIDCCGLRGPQLIKDRHENGDVLFEIGSPVDLLLNHCVFGGFCWQATIDGEGMFLTLNGYRNTNLVSTYTAHPRLLGITNHMPIRMHGKVILYGASLVFGLFFLAFMGMRLPTTACAVLAIIVTIFFVVFYSSRNTPSCLGPGWDQAWMYICPCLGNCNRLHYHYTPSTRLYSIVDGEGEEDIGIQTTQEYRSMIMCCKPACVCVLFPCCISNTKSTTDVVTSSKAGSKVAGRITSAFLKPKCLEFRMTEYSAYIDTKEPKTKDELLKWVLLYNMSRWSTPILLKYPDYCSNDLLSYSWLNSWSKPEVVTQLSDAYNDLNIAPLVGSPGIDVMPGGGSEYGLGSPSQPGYGRGQTSPSTSPPSGFGNTSDKNTRGVDLAIYSPLSDGYSPSKPIPPPFQPTDDYDPVAAALNLPQNKKTLGLPKKVKNSNSFNF